MGWLTFHETRTAKQFFTDMYSNNEHLELVDIAIKNFRTAYLAIRVKESGYVYAQTYMIHRAPKSYENFGYKPIFEFAGPCEAECPERILDKLSPLSEIEAIGEYTGKSIEWAQGWRDRCRKNIEVNKRINKGEVIKAKNPINFTSGAKFEYFKKENRKWYAIVDYGTKFERSFRVRLNGFNNMSYEFVKDL